jgi:hypothetical protein
MVTDATIRDLALSRLGFERLRPGPLRAVAAATGGHDVLAVLPTSETATASKHSAMNTSPPFSCQSAHHATTHGANSAMNSESPC